MSFLIHCAILNTLQVILYDTVPQGFPEFLWIMIKNVKKHLKLTVEFCTNSLLVVLAWAVDNPVADDSISLRPWWMRMFILYYLFRYVRDKLLNGLMVNVLLCAVLGVNVSLCADSCANVTLMKYLWCHIYACIICIPGTSSRLVSYFVYSLISCNPSLHVNRRLKDT